MDNDLRVSLVAACAAAALSALVGVIGGVAFLTLLLRAIVSGALFGCAWFGGVFLLRKTVPGLFDGSGSPSGAEDTGAEEGFRGANIDIVLPGEAASESFAPREEYRDYPGDAFSRPSPAARGFREGPEGDEEASDLAPVDEASLLDPESPGDEAPALPASANPERERRPSSGFEELDILPDLEGFSDTFTASEFGSGGSSAGGLAKGYAGQGGSNQRQGQEGLDPATLAQAVRTILKRDQKG